jgi:hypothetical protein
MNGNALSLNALSLNALSLNALSLNALSLNGLAPQALASIQDPGPSGALARQAMRYIVSCALDSSGSLSFSWTDSGGILHQEVYLGLLGLAPAWQSGPIQGPEASWVSACLIARTNWYGVPVQISARGSLQALMHADANELSTYAIREGAFWGDLFTASPVAYACYDDDNVDAARQHLRDCAAGHLDADGQVEGCGIIQIVGGCADLCNDPHAHWGYFGSCATADDDGDSSAEVISIFLH